MTTDNTTTEVTPIEIATEFVKNSSSTQIAEKMAEDAQSLENMRKNVSHKQVEIDYLRRDKRNILDIVEKFLKEHISEGNEADLDELKELAEELDIELTKDIKVTFTASVEVEMTVPLDFDLEDIDESNFTVSAEFDGMTDVEVDDTDINVEDFEVEEN
jgi:succinate dehydrogenase flavin-adding protein (antitoxin of CptAB toxin-antitoxin module)